MSEFIAPHVNPYHDVSYEEKVSIINYSMKSMKSKIILDPELRTFLKNEELMRHDTLIDTLYWCVRIGSGMQELYKRAYINVKEFSQVSMPEYVLTNKDWGMCLSKLTKAYHKVFTVVNMTDSTYLGGQYLTGSERDDIFRRTNAFLLTDKASLNASLNSYTNTYTDEMQYELNNGGHFYREPRLYLRGPESNDYQKLNYSEILPFYELRCSSNLNHLDAIFETLIEKGCRHIILSVGKFDKIIEFAYLEVLRKYKKNFDAIYISIENMNSDDLLEQLGFVIDVPHVFNYFPKTNMKPYSNYLRNYAVNPALRLTKAALYNAPKYLLSTVGNTYKYLNKGAMTHITPRNRYYGGKSIRDKTQRKRRKTFKRNK